MPLRTVVQTLPVELANSVVRDPPFKPPRNKRQHAKIIRMLHVPFERTSLLLFAGWHASKLVCTDRDSSVQFNSWLLHGPFGQSRWTLTGYLSL